MRAWMFSSATSGVRLPNAGASALRYESNTSVIGMVIISIPTLRARALPSSLLPPLENVTADLVHIDYRAFVGHGDGAQHLQPQRTFVDGVRRRGNIQQ